MSITTTLDRVRVTTTLSSEGVSTSVENTTVVVSVTGGETVITDMAGPRGPAGSPGPAGQRGVDGVQGPQGIPGAIGVTGSQGPAGAQGIKGDTGATGPAGARGIDGATGPQGVPGIKGDTGAVGPQGATGPAGAAAPTRPIPTLVQKATLVNDGDLVLPKKPTVGNIMILITAGWGGNLQSYVPPGFTPIGNYVNGYNNAIYCWIKSVTADDTPVYSLSVPDNQFAVLYEYAGVRGVLPLVGGPMEAMFNGDTFSFFAYGTPYPCVRLGAFEHDVGRNWILNPATGLTVDLYSNVDPAGYHPGVAFHLDDTFQGSITGSIPNGGAQNPVMGLFAVF